MARNGSKALEHVIERAYNSAMLEQCGVDPKAQEAMRLYLKTWVAGPLSSALRYIRGEASASELIEYWGR